VSITQAEVILDRFATGRRTLSEVQGIPIIVRLRRHFAQRRFCSARFVSGDARRLAKTGQVTEDDTNSDQRQTGHPP
jgi:hypothetical protein